MTPALNQQIATHHRWRMAQAEAVLGYRDWLTHNQLDSPDIIRHLQRTLQALHSEVLTLAVCGVQRDQTTALINDLLFAEPAAQALRRKHDIHCPVEYYWNAGEPPGLALLSIHTRTDPRPLQALLQEEALWERHPIAALAQASLQAWPGDEWEGVLARLAETRTIPAAEARSLDLPLAASGNTETSSDQELPAWRHARLNLAHPLLQQGLRILELPAAETLVSEPELTGIALLRAEVLLFIIDASQEISPASCTHWQALSRAAGPDTLKLALLGPLHAQAATADMAAEVARSLGLSAGETVPLDKGCEALGGIISSRLERFQQQSEAQQLLADVRKMLATSIRVLGQRSQNLQEQLEQLSRQGASPEFLETLTEQTRSDYRYYNKKLLTLHSSKRLMRAQADILKGLISAEQFEQHAGQTRERLQQSWTTSAMRRAMVDFFGLLEQDLQALRREIGLAEKMLNALYERYDDEDDKQRRQHRQDVSGRPGSPPGQPPARLSIAPSLQKLKQLEAQAEAFRAGVSTLFSGQATVIDRFFNVLVAQARDLYLGIQTEVGRWANEALTPLSQATQEHKQMLEGQLARLKELARSAEDNRAREQQYQDMMQQVQAQLATAHDLAEVLRQEPQHMTTTKDSPPTR